MAAMFCGCGKSAHTAASASRTTTTTITTAAPTTTAAPLTKSQGLAFARAVNLRPADVPGFTASEAEHETGAKTREGRAFSRCVDAAASYQGLVKADSKHFKESTSASTVTVFSSVEVAHTATAAAEELAAARSPQVRACLSRFARQIFTRRSLRGGSVGAVSVAFFTPPAPGTRGSFGWRISSTFSLHGIHFPFQFDVLGFGYRTTTVVLFAVGLPQPLPSAQEQRLFTLLVKRAQDFRS